MTKEIHVIRKAHTLVAFDRKLNGHVYLNDADVAYDEKGFVHVGGHYDGPFVSESSGRDRMILPGFVNVHCHSGEEPISKGIFEDMGTAALWGNALYEYSNLLEIDDDAIEASLTVMVGDLMRSGVTTLLDIAGPHASWLPTLAKSGARAFVAPGFREAQWHVEDSHRLDFRWDRARGRDAFARALEVVDTANAHPSGRLGGVVAPSQIETCSPELLQDAVAAARQRGMPITIHAAQTMTEHEELLRRHGLTAVQYLEKLGLLGKDLILGHCIFVDSHSWTRQRTEIDLRLLADRQTTVAHCPVTFSRSGMALESVGRYRRAGVNVALGTDSYPFNMLEEMRQARGDEQQCQHLAVDRGLQVLEGVELAVELEQWPCDGVEGIMAEIPAGDTPEHRRDGGHKRVAPRPLRARQRHRDKEQIRGDRKDRAFDKGDDAKPDNGGFSCRERHRPVI